MRVGRGGVGVRYFGAVIEYPAVVRVVGEGLLDCVYCAGDVGFC